jgi:hypothetical protein
MYLMTAEAWLREPATVGGGRHAVTHGVHDDLVDGRLGDELIGDAGAERIHHARALALEPLVALHALLGVVLCLALLGDELDAVHTAVTRVDHRDVVVEAVGERRPAGGVGAGAVDQHGDEHLVLGGHRRRRGHRRHREHQQPEDEHSVLHGSLLWISAETATGEASPW